MCYGVGSACTAAFREAEGRDRVLDMLAMTQTPRTRRAARLASLALVVVVVSACRKHAVTTAQTAAAPVQKTAAVSGPSASVAKPPDASPEAKRPAPHPPAAPCIDVPG